MIYELQTVVLLEGVYRHFPKNEKELSVIAVTEFRHFTCGLQNWTLVTPYCNNTLKMSKLKNQGLFYLNIIIIIIWGVVINFLDQQQDNTAAVSTELIHYMKVEENLQSYTAALKLQFAPLWSNMLWTVTAFCVSNSASNLAHLFTESFQVVQETKQHASHCTLTI